MSKRCLFVIRDFPRPVLSAAAVLRAEEALSGTHTSGILVAEGLARRGHEIGIYIMHGQVLVESAVRGFDTLQAAADWIGSGTVIWLSYGDDSILDRLSAVDLKPVVWTHIAAPWSDRAWLESGRIAGIVTVSDSARLPMLRSAKHECVGRIYNPLPPFFASAPAKRADRFERRLVVYAGAAGTSKGLHRLLEMWRFAHQTDPCAKLVLAGTGQLYGNERQLGPLGIAAPDFEARYVEPITAQFGSLKNAGIEAVGLLKPHELRHLYASSSVGVVNMNWHEYTETFCCAGVEMLATGLPVFSVARGALPETIGRSGGAVLTRNEPPALAAREFNALLADPAGLAKRGAEGQQFVRSAYDYERIIDTWAQLLQHGTSIEALCGRWRGPKTLRYIAESMAGKLHAPWLLDVPTRSMRLLRRIAGRT